MKRTLYSITLTLAFLLLPAVMLAGPITREQAKQKAESYLSSCKGSRMLKPVTTGKKLAPGKNRGAADSFDTYYVFNRGENEGFVIVAGDDQIDGVMGYTDNGEFDYQNLPDNMRDWLDDYAAYIENVKTGKAEAPKKLPTHPSIPIMLKTTWNQGWPYNNECPIHNGSRSVTGCVATAFAQVLYFQHEKSVTETQADIPGYTTYTAGLSVPGIKQGAPIDWDNMLSSYGGSPSGVAQTAVAKLMLYCGVAVEMDYTSNSSGAHTEMCADAMNKYFGYSKARYVYKSNYSEDGWDQLIYNELNEGRVVLLSGYNSEAGHAFVCDGYDGNKCYHINWGWGGQSDGYFLMNSLNPSSQGIGGSGDGYSQGLGGVIGAIPDNYEAKELKISNATVKKLCLEYFDTDGNGVFTYGEAAAVTDLGEVFKNQKFAAFTELYYFTGLETVSDYAFSGNTLLTNLTLPKNLKKIGNYAFSGCTKLKAFKYFEYINEIGEGAFQGCKALPDFVLPEGVAEIKANTFAGCSAFTSFNLPVHVLSIGSNAFDGCTKLSQFTVNTMDPSRIVLGEQVFANIDLSAATLNVMQGTEDFFANAEQWKDFGNFYQERSLAGGSFCELATDKYFYLYNVGKGSYLSKGEAWGTQAVVSGTPMRFQLKRSSTMPENTYYILFDSGDGNVLFRTANDNNVGVGVKAAFVDGGDEHITDKTSWWTVTQESDGSYLFQVPKGQTGHTDGKYWGVDTDHKSNAVMPTNGVYYDVDYAAKQQYCQWRFVEYNEELTEKYQEGLVLANLLEIARSRNVDYSDEQRIYDDIHSSADEMRKAQKVLRRKLGFINFKDDVLRQVAVTNWDSDGNGEISYSEAASVTYFTSLFYNSKVKTLEDFEYFKGVNTIYGNGFQGCSLLEKLVIPSRVTTIYYWAFRGCSKLDHVDIPAVTTLGERTFADCTALKTVSIATDDPSRIDMGEAVFENVNVKKATLIVPAGSKDLYANAPQWKEFGTIQEMRPNAKAPYSPVEYNVQGYICNIGEYRYLNKGEAWGTQSVVAPQGMVYQIRRNTNMPEGQVYLYSDATGKEGKVLFRTDQDSKVGVGTKACFVDGSLTERAYWQLTEIGDNLFTLAVPEGQDGAGDLLGVDTGHASDYTWGTYGAYWDFSPDNSTGAVKWGFILKDDMESAENFDSLVRRLKKLLETAEARGVEKTEEQAVYDNFSSTEEEIASAIESLKLKLGYIEFADSRAKTVSTNNWDDDDDSELTTDEAALVTDIGTRFKGVSAIRSFEELRYFTSITQIADEAFRGCSSLTSIYLPEKVSKVGEKAFTGCSALKYMAILSSEMAEATEGAVPRSVILFVPESLVEAYQQDSIWGKHTIRPYTGSPVVKPAEATKIYGASKANIEFEVLGAPVNGVPEMICETEATSPVGEYEIICQPGTITSPNLTCENGVLTVVPASLTITAKSFTRNVGEENPEFTVTYRGWKNKEKADILTSPVVIECAATKDSPAGVYDIIPSGAVAPNYEITYVNGTLTVLGEMGDVNNDGDTNISDVVAVINVMAKTAEYSNADVNNDGVVDISDVVAVINIIAGL